MIGAQHGLYGHSASESFWADWAIETFNDFWKREFYSKWMPWTEAVDEEQLKFLEEHFSKFAAQLEHRLKSNDG